MKRGDSCCALHEVEHVTPKNHSRLTRVGERVGKTRITIWRGVKAGTFPAPIELGPNSVGWYEDEINDWLASRPRRTYDAEHPAEAEAGAA